VARFWHQEGCRHGFCEKTAEASSMSNKASSSWLQDRPLLAKAHPISYGGSTSLITYLRKGKHCYTTAVRKEE